MYALSILEEKTRGTQDIKKAKSQELYHMSLAIVEGAARVSVSIILAVDHSALDSFLDLMRRNNKIKRASFKPQLQTTRRLPVQLQRLSSGKVLLFPYLSAEDAVNHDDDETFQRVEDGEEDLEEGGAAVRDGQHGRHPGEGQQGQNHTGAPERRPEGLENTSDCGRLFL